MKYKLSNKELDVMQVLWAADTDLCITDFIRRNPELSTSTVQVALRSLLKKSYIRVTNIVQHGKVFARTYLPCFTEADYMMEQLRASSLSQDVFIAALVQKEDDPETLATLEKLIAEQRERLMKKDE